MIRRLRLLISLVLHPARAVAFANEPGVARLASGDHTTGSVSPAA